MNTKHNNVVIIIDGHQEDTFGVFSVMFCRTSFIVFIRFVLTDKNFYIVLREQNTYSSPLYTIG